MYQLLGALCAPFYHAAATMPLIVALTLISGRRGQGQFFLQSAQWLLALNLLLAPACPLWLAFTYLGEISHFQAPLGQQLAPLLQPAGRGWVTAFLAWGAAAICVALAARALNSLRWHWQGDRVTLGQLRRPLLACGLALGFFFATFVLINWPFAGLPDGLPLDRAALAVFRHAARAVFMALCPAGAIALVALHLWAGRLNTRHLFLGVRWFSAWGAIGALPHWLSAWAMQLGVALQSTGAIAQGLPGHVAPLLLLTGALGCWCFLLWKPQFWRPLGLLALGLFLLRSLWPILHVQ